MEEAIRIAVKTKWKNSNDHICFFHYCQALFVNIGNKGLFSVYRSDGKDSDYRFYKFGRCFMCLALIHPAVVIRGWNLLNGQIESETPDEYVEQMYDFAEYHQGYYMKSWEFIKAW
eukprot:62418_1